MPLELDAEFRFLSRAQQILKCYQMAREAEGLAATCAADKRAGYAELAVNWYALAHEMEKSS